MAPPRMSVRRRTWFRPRARLDRSASCWEARFASHGHRQGWPASQQKRWKAGRDPRKGRIAKEAGIASFPERTARPPPPLLAENRKPSPENLSLPLAEQFSPDPPGTRAQPRLRRNNATGPSAPPRAIRTPASTALVTRLQALSSDTISTIALIGRQNHGQKGGAWGRTCRGSTSDSARPLPEGRPRVDVGGHKSENQEIYGPAPVRPRKGEAARRGLIVPCDLF